MAYTIRYGTNKGGSGMTTASTNAGAKDKLLQLFKEKKQCRVEKDGILIGASYKDGGKWFWYMDSEA